MEEYVYKKNFNSSISVQAHINKHFIRTSATLSYNTSPFIRCTFR